jgi:hypothetical protein
VGVFGEKLRKKREQRGLELEAISNTTKISIRMLRALEEEHFQQLPGGVFNRGFVRAYARQVGLDEEEAIADYVTALRESLLQQSILPELPAREPEPSRVVAPEPADTDPEAQEPEARQPDIKQAPENVPPVVGLPASNKKDDDADLQNKAQDAVQTNAQTPEHRPEDRRKQGRRNHEDRRNNNEVRRHEARRDQDRLDKDRLDKARLDEARQEQAGQKQARRPQDSAKPRAVNPLASRFRQKYPAGTPAEPVAESSVHVPWGKLAVALLLVTLTLAFWNFRPHAQPPASHPVVSSTQSRAPLSTPAPSFTQPSQSESSLASSPDSSADNSQRRVETPSPAGTQFAGASSSPIPAATAPRTNSASASPASSPNASQPEFKPRLTHTAAAKPPVTFTLQIRADETTWVSLMVDGKPAARETLIAPAHTSVRATHEIVVKTGNAAGISFQLNGKPIPAQGNEGQAITYLFDATSVHVVQ